MKRALTLSLVMAICAMLNAQLVINEFMAGNTTTYQDESDDYDDWIEIYNTSDATVSLNGYYLTDNFNNPLKFKLPSTVSIAAKGYLVIIADNNKDQGNLHANFKLSLDGEEIAIYKLSGGDTILIDSLTFPIQLNDISLGRFPDGIEYFEYFEVPTPGAANASGSLEGIAPMPVFSISGGFYAGTQSVDITTDLAGGQIRYTTDGSEPDTSSSLYSTSVSGDTTFILKAKVFADHYVPSKTQVSTYFIDEHFNGFDESERLPVVSISCRFDDLYKSKTGLLTNAFSDIEKMVNVELFEPDGQNVINQYAGLKVFGHATRTFIQKSLVAYARSKYSKGSFDYKFFDDKPFEKYESFVMRNGGSDWSLTYFRDALCQALVRNNMDIDAQGSKHAILYLNGKFYGIVDLKEKVSEHYVEQNCGADPNNIDMLNHEGDAEVVIEGDATKYYEFKNFVVSSDLTKPVLYNAAERQMDVNNYINTQIAEIYIANIDMFLNSKYWREKVNYGKWRWIFYDTEISFGQGDYSYADDYGTVPSSNTLAFATETWGGSNWPYLRPWSSEKMFSLLKNETFRDQFIQTFAVHINTTFKKERVLNMIDSMQQVVRNEIPYQIEAYGGYQLTFNPYGTHFTTIEEWEYYVDLMRYFAIERPDYMRSHIIDRFELAGTYQLTTLINDSDRGEIYIQDIHVPSDSAGIYFDNIPLNISAIPNEGYRFVKWEGVSDNDSLLSDLRIVLSEDKIIKAIFEEEGDAMITEIFYQPSSGNSEFIEIKNPKHATAIDISKYELSGDISFIFPDSFVLEPLQFVIVAADDSLIPGDKTRVFQWTTGTLGDISGKIILKDSFGTEIDSVQYLNTAPWPVVDENYSIELISLDQDNNIGNNWNGSFLDQGSPGAPVFNDAVLLLKINEFMAANTNVYADEQGECNDWIELVNTGDEEVNIGGLYLTNNLSTPALYQIQVNNPKETKIKPGEHKIIWADAEPNQGPLHLGFKLNSSGGAIGLSADGRTVFEQVIYSVQSANVSSGRHFDGTGTWKTFESSTPGYVNSYAPEFTSEPVLWCQQAAPYEYNITTLDSENDELFIGYYLKPYWATFTITGNGTATISGTMPGGATTKYNIKVFVTDGYSAPVVQDYVISRGNPPVGTFDESLAANEVSCYPNPTDGLIYVDFKATSPVIQLRICNVSGQVVFTKTISGNEDIISEQIDLSGNKKGVYYLTITADEGTTTQKVILY